MSGDERNLLSVRGCGNEVWNLEKEEEIEAHFWSSKDLNSGLGNLNNQKSFLVMDWFECD